MFSSQRENRSNRNQIYRYLYHQEKVSQQRIAQDLGLSMPTVTQNLNALREMELIRDDSTFESTGGRKARGFRIDPEARLALGLDITANHISLVAIDMKGHILASNRIRHRFTDNLFYYATLGKLVDRFIADSRLPVEKILGLGICLTAIVASDGKTILSARRLGAPKDLYDKLAPHLSLPFRLFNDGNSGGFAEWWDMEPEGTLVYLSLSNGVGGAMVSGRSLYTGDHYKACEFGHVTLVPDGRPCYCGQKGCLNAYCSAHLLSDMADGSMAAFFTHVSRGEEPYTSAFHEYLKYLAIAVNNLRMQYDCDIILGGYVGSYMAPYLEEFREMVQDRNPLREDGSFIHTCRHRYETAGIGSGLHFINDFIDQI